jgi:GTP-binding protein
MVFTKTDKQSTSQTKALITAYLAKLGESWDELPRHFLTSAETALGREELLAFIAEVNQQWRAEPTSDS